MRVIFMGTPDFSVGTLQALIDAGHEVVLAVTQPDKPKGRGKSMQFPPCLLYTSPSPRDSTSSRMPSSA